MTLKANHRSTLPLVGPAGDPLPRRCQISATAPTLRPAAPAVRGYHARRRGADEQRDRTLRRLGYRVLRLEAELVLQDLTAAVAQVQPELARSR
jgi:hypothetical protein